MERVISTKDFEYYTHLRKIIFDLEFADKEHWWLISDIEAYPHKETHQKLIYQQDYLLIKTSDLMKMLVHGVPKSRTQLSNFTGSDPSDVLDFGALTASCNATWYPAGGTQFL